MSGIVYLIALVAAYVGYVKWLTNGIKPREFHTTLSVNGLRSLFEDRVAHAGWKVVDDGNPMVAQSSLAMGIRQQIGLHLSAAENGRTAVRVGPHRWVRKWTGIPTKAHTIRIRLNSYVDAVRAQDPGVQVALGDLHRR